jgi:hypothetical protein
MEPHKAEDPVRYHQRMADLESVSGSAGADNFIGFSLTTCRDRKVRVLSEMYPAGVDCNDWGEEQLHGLEALFQHFHHMLITHDDQRQLVDINPHCATPNAQGHRSLASDDYSPLHRMVFMMAYGQPLRSITPFDPHAPGFQKLVMTTFAAADMIRHVRSPTTNHREGSSVKFIESVWRFNRRLRYPERARSLLVVPEGKTGQSEAVR